MRKQRRMLDLPEYASMSACASATGIPLEVLKAAKAGGCPAFRHGRVMLQEFLGWFFTQDDKSETDWTRENKRLDAMLKRVKLANEEAQTVNFALVTKFVNDLVANCFFGELLRLENYFPPTLKGKTEVEIKREVGKQIATIKNLLQSKLNAWSEAKGKQ